jgi:hypothetical protein
MRIQIHIWARMTHNTLLHGLEISSIDIQAQMYSKSCKIILSLYHIDLFRWEKTTMPYHSYELSDRPMLQQTNSLPFAVA